MGVRKNAKFLTSTEQENFVRACVLMKADIVNPAAPAADRYSRWDELVAIHRMIQNANSPATSNVNFGHGGSGSYSFLSWHRYFLHLFELQLQSYVPGVMLPYWDWSDPAPLMTDTFLGPDGSGVQNIVSSGYFAQDAPDTGGNSTPSPAWWPAALTGWNLANGFGTLVGPLKRNLSGVSGLPSVADIRDTLARTTYSSFQNTLESGSGLASGHQMHNGLHGWVSGHMGSLTGSPFDPIFYLHHCNIDRLWAMWQMDGHATLYPAAGADPEHGPTDLMYPWVGGAAGYSSNLSFGTIVMPDFSALGGIRNQDVLDHRALGYTYDTLAVIGVGLDRTGSMLGLTPDPMTGAGTVTKWEAATRGVSAFLQDCETVQESGAIYVTAGVKTFRSLGLGNDFTSVFAGTPYGLIKSGTGYSRATFDSVIATMSPGGGTPLADALQDVEDTLVEPPFGWLPADEQRYLAMLTDGIRTSGALLSSIPDGSYSGTVIFALGFGTAADVDYTTLANMVAKGRSAGFTQVFHGENAGVIDKFYSDALARAIGFSTVFDPVIELFAGEHTHMEFSATSADENFFLTAQGVDFEDRNWSFSLIGPDGHVAYADGMHAGHAHGGAAAHGRRPHVTAVRNNGRLSLMLQRDSAPFEAWVGVWTLMVAYRAVDMAAMVMPDLGELMFPVAAGPVRGPRYARLLLPPEKRVAARAIAAKPRHQLDVRPGSTNSSSDDACAVIVNVYARTRLRMELVGERELLKPGASLKVAIDTDLLDGAVVMGRGFARLAAPARDIARLVARVKTADVPRAALLKGGETHRFDTAKLLAALERKNPKIAQIRDEEVKVVNHRGGPFHLHVDETDTPGVYHLGVYVEGAYCPEGEAVGGHGGDGGHHAAHAGHDAPVNAAGKVCTYEPFTRLFNISVAVAERKDEDDGEEKPKAPKPVAPKPKPAQKPAPKTKRQTAKRPATTNAKAASARSGTKRKRGAGR